MEIIIGLLMVLFISTLIVSSVARRPDRQYIVVVEPQPRPGCLSLFLLFILGIGFLMFITV